VRLLHRTTRSVSLTSEGERALEKGRRVLDELEQLEQPIDPKAKLSGRISVTAPVLFGQMHVVPIVTEFLSMHPALDARMLLLDRVVSLADEGVDVAVRIGALTDSAMRARVVGHVRSVLCASPAYLRRAGALKSVEDLGEHECIAFTGTTPVPERWTFGRKNVAVKPRLIVNTGQAALDAAQAGLGIVRLLSYQVQNLKILFEDDDLPVSLLHLPGIQARAAPAFLELATERLRAVLSSVPTRSRI
jgi:DNA-binding transcriptional LysR family regulator